MIVILDEQEKQRLNEVYKKLSLHWIAKRSGKSGSELNLTNAEIVLLLGTIRNLCYNAKT